MMIERKTTVFPILTPMRHQRRLETTGKHRWRWVSRIPAATRTAGWCGWIVAVVLTSIASAQLPADEPAPDQQPVSPWSRPFRVSIPTVQPPRHVETQLDSWGETHSSNRVPEVASSEKPRSETRSETRVRASLASRVSNDVLTPATVASNKEVRPIDTPPGWRNIETSLRSSLDRCDHLLRRGAVHSSRREVVQSLRQLLRAIDLHKQRWESEPACQQAIRALKESEDFETNSMTDITSVQRLVQSHQTPVLHETALDSISPAIAAQHYRSYARDAFIIAADNHPWAADLFYALGKTYERESQQDPSRQMTLLQHATVCFQAAYAIDPRRPQIASQLGFNLLQLDRIDEAARALQASIAVQPTANAYLNIAEVYRRKGSTQQMQSALHLASALTPSETHYSPENPQVTEIPPEEFAKISPPPPAYQLYQTPSEITSRPVAPRTLR
jgi:tetratricopeptide (TPR) repeat protein